MTYKTEIIERLFFERWDADSTAISDPIISLSQVQFAIRDYNQRHPELRKPISDANPANFAKDFFRVHARANQNWPAAVLAAGYTGRQLQQGGKSFEFVALTAGQTKAVEVEFIPIPNEHTRRVRVESVSLPLASKRLGRSDEPWLIQVLIRLRVFETHLALTSQQHIVQLDHLQTNVKLRGAEIDALFLGVTQRSGEGASEVIVCCEAKSRRDDIVPHQILNGVRAAFTMKITQNVIIPIAVKAIAPSEIYVVEFAPILRDRAASTEKLEIATTAIYELVPPVQGIGR